MEEIKVNTHIYQIIRLLGKGKGGYTYLAIFQGKKYALKKIHHEPCEYYTFGDKLESELKDYQKLKGMGILMPELIEVDKDQEIIIKEYLEGDTVFEMVKKGEDISRCLDEMKKMCEILYANNTNIVHFLQLLMDKFCNNLLMVVLDYLDVFHCNLKHNLIHCPLFYLLLQLLLLQI